MKLIKTFNIWLTAFISCILLSAIELNLAWFVLLFVDIVLILWCRLHISLREFVRYSGYRWLYLHLKVSE